MAPVDALVSGDRLQVGQRPVQRRAAHRIEQLGHRIHYGTVLPAALLVKLCAHAAAGKISFLDICTRVEATYVGMPVCVDALLPFVEHQELMTDWDPERNSYQLEPAQDFAPEVSRRLAEKGLDKSEVVVLICRSGDRSSRAANRLADDGFSRVYSVVDGFEGDLSPEGRRSVNGWKNAGLPWSYKLDKARLSSITDNVKNIGATVLP